MTIQEIREWWKSEPFQPFEIVLVDGRVFRVPHPDFIFVPPGRGTWVYVVPSPGAESAEHVNTAVIGSIRRLSEAA